MNDDDFLRSFADRAVPDVPVHTERVIPRAHRRHRIIRTAQSIGVIAVLGVVAGGIGWAWQDAPNPIATPSPTISPSPTAAPTSTPDPEPSTEAPAPPVQIEEPAPPALQITADLPYWYIRSEWVSNGDTGYTETWVSPGRIGLWMSDGNVDSASGRDDDAAALPWVIDGEQVSGLTVLDRLPTDAGGLRVVIEQTVAVYGPPTSRVEQDIFLRAWGILEYGGVAPLDLRLAALDVLTESPYATSVRSGSDSIGRPGTRIECGDELDAYRLVVDPDTALLLESTNLVNGNQVVHTTQNAVAALPFAPSLPDPDDVYGD